MKNLRINSFLLPLTLVSLITILLRIYHLGHNDFWYDEAFSLYRALGHYPKIDPQPPLYFLLLRFWTILLGKSEFFLRMFSVVPAVLSIILVYKIGAFLLDKKTALFSAVILSFSPMHIWYSQEVRPFSLFTLLTLISVYYFCLALKFKKNYYWIVTCLVLTISLYVSHVAFLLITALSLIFIIHSYRYLFKIWLLCIFISLLLFLPWLSMFFMHLRFVTHNFWIAKPNLKQILFTIENFNLGYTATPLMYLSSWVLFGGLFFFGVFNLFKNRKGDILLLLCTVFILPIITSFLISQKYPIYLDRHLISFIPFYYLIVSYGLVNLKLYLRLVSGFFVISLAIVSLAFYYVGYVPSPLMHHLGAYDKKPFKTAVRFILNQKQDQDIIAITNEGIVVPFGYYLEVNPVHENIRFPQLIYSFFCRDNLDTYWADVHDLDKNRKKDMLVDISNANDVSAISVYRRIWLVSGSWARDYTLDNNSIAVRDWMSNKYNCTFEQWIDGILIGLYENKKVLQ